MRSLSVLIVLLVLFNCKPRSSQLDDVLVTAADGRSTLYYIDDEDNHVVRAYCGRKTNPTENLSGQSLREKCKTILARVPVAEVKENLARLYQQEVRPNSKPQQQDGTYYGYLEPDEQKILDNVIKYLRIGKDGKVGSALEVQYSAENPVPQQIGLIFASLLSTATNSEFIPPANETPATDKSLARVEISGFATNSHEFASNIPQVVFSSLEVQISRIGEYQCPQVLSDVFVKLNGRWEKMVRDVDDGSLFYNPRAEVAASAFRVLINNPRQITYRCALTFVRREEVMPQSEIAPVDMQVHHDHHDHSDEAPVRRGDRDDLMRRLMAKRSHRLKHYLWHSARNTWARSESTPWDRQYMRSIGWEPKYPILYRRNGQIDYQTMDAQNSLAGEDFFWMHRQMIVAVREMLRKNGHEMYEPFEFRQGQIVPQFRVVFENMFAKTNQGLNDISQRMAYYTNPELLRRVSLSRLGLEVEFTVHNSLHTRYADRQAYVRSFQDDPLRRGNFGRRWQWDSPNYDHLADSYSAAVNPIFWRIHGWVDQVVDRWLEANDYDPSQISDKPCEKPCFYWRGRWEGPGQFQVADNPFVRVSQTHGSNVIDPKKMPDKLSTRLSKNSFHVPAHD